MQVYQLFVTDGGANFPLIGVDSHQPY